MKEFTEEFLHDSVKIIQQIDLSEIERTVHVLADTRKLGGRVFFAGSGGGAGHSSHAACDFRKLAGLEAYSVTDNVSELTARINDEGWDTSYSEYLKVSKFDSSDALFIFSVGGGSLEKNISPNLVNAIDYAREKKGSVLGIVGRDGGDLRRKANVSILIPSVNPNTVTPQTEGFQALIWHLIVSHPILQLNIAKWESTEWPK